MLRDRWKRLRRYFRLRRAGASRAEARGIVRCPYLPTKPPTEREAEAARRIARQRGWLTDEGWVWDE
jgi:hypothetical protein